MRKFTTYIIFSSLFLLSLVPLHTSHADTGPKPTMSFEFSQDFGIDPVIIISGQLLECDEADCADAKPLEELGPQHFSCDENSCDALAYGFSTYHMLEIEFSDGKTRRSNIFESTDFYSSFLVKIRQDDLVVEQVSWTEQWVDDIPGLNFPTGTIILLICGLCGVGVIVLIVLLVFLALRTKKK